MSAYRINMRINLNLEKLFRDSCKSNGVDDLCLTPVYTRVRVGRDNLPHQTSC